LKVNRLFGGTYRPRLQGRRISRARNQHESRWKTAGCRAGFLLGFFDPEDGGDVFLEMSVDFQRITPPLWEPQILHVRRTLPQHKVGNLNTLSKLTFYIVYEQHKCFTERLYSPVHRCAPPWEKPHETSSGSSAFKFLYEICVLIMLLRAVIKQRIWRGCVEREIRFVLEEQYYEIIYVIYFEHITGLIYTNYDYTFHTWTSLLSKCIWLLYFQFKRNKNYIHRVEKCSEMESTVIIKNTLWNYVYSINTTKTYRL
jgi:hypothetical protein